MWGRTMIKGEQSVRGTGCRAQGVEHRGHTGSREGLGRRGASRGERTGQALEGREEGQNRGPG